MMTLPELRNLLAQFTYKPGWAMRYRPCERGALVWVAYDGTGDYGAEPWVGRKLYVSPHATRSEVIGTVQVCVELAERHEMLENLRKSGQVVTDPHIDREGLLSVIASGIVGQDVRDDAMLVT
jgi:hypothetical protein